MNCRELIVAVIVVFLLADQAVAAPSDKAASKDPFRPWPRARKALW
jgi:hypothetical protein